MIDKLILKETSPCDAEQPNGQRSDRVCHACRVLIHVNDREELDNDDEFYSQQLIGLTVTLPDPAAPGTPPAASAPSLTSTQVPARTICCVYALTVALCSVQRASS